MASVGDGSRGGDDDKKYNSSSSVNSSTSMNLVNTFATDRSNHENTGLTLYRYATDWGGSSFPPTILATLITALHLRPWQSAFMSLPPILLFASYLNLQDLTRVSAGVSATCSGLYLLLTKRRKDKVIGLNARSLTRGAALGLAIVNGVSGGLTYFKPGQNDFDESDV